LSGVQQKARVSEQEHLRLTADLKGEREKLAEARRRGDEQERERARLERELQRMKKERDKLRRTPLRNRARETEGDHPWWRRPVLLGGLLFGGLVAWVTSLVVALSMLSP
jgi:hypothetical protein